MQPIVDLLEQRVAAALAAIADDAVANPPAVVKPSQDARFGDYQANGVMALAKRLQRNPRELAQQTLAHLDVSDLCAEPEVAGPGFINFRLRPDWMAARLSEMLQDDERLAVDPAPHAPTTVVDFSGPNVAKQMHVGHLRSTIIGDVIARVLEFHCAQPDRVIRQNHVGDWGTQFGMLIAYLKDLLHNSPSEQQAEQELGDLEAFYKKAKERNDADPAFAKAARDEVVDLQSNQPTALDMWHRFRETSLQHCQEIYGQLGVKLTAEDVRGESFYNDRLPGVIADLKAEGLLQESDGAQCVFLDGFKTKDGEKLPLIVQKSDGAYLYATTDLAAIRFRVDELRAQRLIYVTDARQKLHFEMVFAAARAAGRAPDNVTLEHVPFGSVLGPDGKPFKTRSGENVKLKDLLDEAVLRARRVVEEKNPDLTAAQKDDIAAAVGVGAVKYADLSNNLTADYVFDYDKMLAMEGNTAPYMQYAYARVRSIFRKGGVDEADLLAQAGRFTLDEPDERTLALRLLRYGEVIETVARDLRPHLLTNYLFDLAQAFSAFYTNCPVLKAAADTRASRLLLCSLTARTIKHGLNLLGIRTPEQM